MRCAAAVPVHPRHGPPSITLGRTGLAYFWTAGNRRLGAVDEEDPAGGVRGRQSLAGHGEVADEAPRPSGRSSQGRARPRPAGTTGTTPWDWQRHTSQSTPGKNVAGTGGFGPWLVTPDEFGDPYAHRMATRANGEVVQSVRISNSLPTEIVRRKIADSLKPSIGSAGGFVLAGSTYRRRRFRRSLHRNRSRPRRASRGSYWDSLLVDQRPSRVASRGDRVLAAWSGLAVHPPGS
ncbi:fumarylacetoacetate hydrolase family protein [Streptomyces sp. SID10815]|nr:fumarylacetoacetate hydrolase family protein [Streptomyces sp. SID10815]